MYGTFRNHVRVILHGETDQWCYFDCGCQSRISKYSLNRFGLEGTGKHQCQNFDPATSVSCPCTILYQTKCGTATESSMQICRLQQPWTKHSVISPQRLNPAQPSRGNGAKRGIDRKMWIIVSFNFTVRNVLTSWQAWIIPLVPWSNHPLLVSRIPINYTLSRLCFSWP